MRPIPLILFAISCLLPIGTFAQGQDGYVPERRLAINPNVDFFGSDLRAIFDTTFEACRATCLTDPSCTAFTFNTRAGSCFPKTEVTERQPYEGAVSAIVIDTPAQVLGTAPTRVAELDFLGQGDFEAARRVAEGLAQEHRIRGDFSAADYTRASTDARNANNRSRAVSMSGAAVVLSDAPDLWMTYAEDLLAASSTNVRNPVGRALMASINGYLRADDDVTRAALLLTMSRALEEAGRGQDTVPALRLAIQLSPRQDIAAALDRAINLFGFRIVDHTVESDMLLPRVCAEFSEPLQEAGIDYASFVQVSLSDYTVEPSGNRLCIGGAQHGERLEVTFRAGLPAASGEATVKSVDLNVYFRDRFPSVSFPGRAYVLPKTGNPAIPATTVNAGSLDLVLSRVGDRNFVRAVDSGTLDSRFLSSWGRSGTIGDIGEEIWRGTGAVENVLNQDVTTRLPMGEIIADLDPGLYVLRARVVGENEQDSSVASQSFIISDLGLATMSGTDGLHLFVRSLGSAEPLGGLTATLISEANTILGTAQTDADGYASFPPGLTRGTGGSAPSVVMVQNGEDDLNFLSLTDPEFDLSDRGVEGREPAPPIDIFLTTDRGAYRAGETIHATALSRDSKAIALDGIPLTAILKRPDGVEYSRTLSNTPNAGGHVFALPVGSTVARGTWTLAVHADADEPPLATQTVLVEDFLPERIDFTLALPETDIGPTDTPPLDIEARYLFGAPGADLPVEGTVRLRAVRELPAYPDYAFGRHDASFAAGTEALAGARTDDQGRATIPVSFPQIDADDRPQKAEIITTISEGSGRPVERRIERILTPAAPLIGIKPLFDDVAARSEPARFEIIAVGTDGDRMAMPVRWELNRLDTRYQWYRTFGNWSWEPITTRRPVASGELSLSAGGTDIIEATPDWGRYELRVERADGTFGVSSVDFYAGWYAPSDASQTPDTLNVSLDRPSYRPGETATVTIDPRFDGTALISVVSNELIDMQTLDVTEGETTIALPVTEEWGTGAYVTATVIRPMSESEGRNPSRALGLAHAAVDPGERLLTAQFDVPEEAAPRAPLEVALKVDGVAAGETAHATIAAVDVGILNITGFDSPDPAGHYFGQRKLGMAMRDVYGRLIDGMNGDLGEVRSGGDAQRQSGYESPPPTEELVAYFSGPVEVGADGYARTSFDLPSFNGTVRLMAVAWSSTGVGQAEAEVLVRDPVVVTASVPRFLSPGDTSRLLLEIVHAKGPSGEMGLGVTADGVTLTGAAPAIVELADLGKAVVEVPLRADEVGDHTLSVTLTTPDGEELVKDLTLPVRHNDPEISRRSRFALAPGDTFTFDENVFTGLHVGSATATISSGPLARFDAPGLLAMLDRYPYGCTEQVTSVAMPLLYFDDVISSMGLAERRSAEARVENAITRVLANQAPNGGFGLWRPRSGDLWLDAFVTDFLGRARTQGFEVPEIAFRTAMENLRNRVNYYPDFEEGGEDLAYALYVLAREGAAAVGDLRYYADARGAAFSTPLAAAQVGAALASYGDTSRADAMFTRASQQISRDARPDVTAWRLDYGTRLRDLAGVLALGTEAGTERIDREELASRVTRFNRGYSTQEALWSLLAAHALIEDDASPLTIDGAPADGPLVELLDGRSAGTRPVAIRNTGEEEVMLTLTTFGVPSEPEPADGNGWRIARTYYDLEGQLVEDLSAVAVGTRLVAVIEVTPLGRRGARLMINDPLPAGFEIDNPNLIRSGDIRQFDWLEPAQPEHTEFRSDRFLAAMDNYGDQPLRLAYIVRAISPGDFHHPAASVEDMYRPEFRARTGQGRITIVQ